MSTLLANIGAFATVALGLLGALFPGQAAKFVSISPIGAVGISEVRATYGGFFLALGISALWLQHVMVFTVLGFAWLGASFVRLTSVLIDDSRSLKNWGGIVFECAIACLCLSILGTAQ